LIFDYGGSAVADESSNSPSPFDVRKIKSLVALMARHHLSEIDLREGEMRIRLRRGGPRRAASAPEAPPAYAPVSPAPAVAAPSSSSPAEASKPAKQLLTIKSPTPGTFYSAPSPTADPFVRVGSRVAPTTVVCVIEAMKIFNEIQAECAGIISEILVENQQPVEWGQVLFKVDPTG
jgi:acetyl-CoA carboxylase biotin carboxyl carrier protein